MSAFAIGKRLRRAKNAITQEYLILIIGYLQAGRNALSGITYISYFHDKKSILIFLWKRGAAARPPA